MSDVRFIPAAAFASHAVIVLKAHFGTCRTGSTGLCPGKSAASGITHLIWQMRSEHVTSSDDPFAAKKAKRVVNMFNN